MLAGIGVLILLVIARLTYIFWDASFATPMDESRYSIRLLKTGKVNTLYLYTTYYEVGDTVTVFRSDTHYGDVKDVLNN